MNIYSLSFVADFLVTNVFVFLHLKMSLCFLHSQRIFLWDIGFRVSSSFLLVLERQVSHFLLSSRWEIWSVSVEKSAAIWLIISLSVMYPLCQVLWKCFFLVYRVQKFDYDVTCHKIWGAYPVWCLLSFSNFVVYAIWQIWEIFSYSSNSFFSPLFSCSCSIGFSGSHLFVPPSLFFSVAHVD